MNNRAQHTTYNIDREENDFYATDPKAIDLLFQQEEFDNIWECAAGAGHLSDRIKQYNKQVYSSDLIDRGKGYDLIDFLNTNKNWPGDIITNPPYKYAEEFVYKGLSLLQPKRKMAFFLRLLFMESKRRQKLFLTYPPKTIYVLSSRVECRKNPAPTYMFNGGTAVCYAWFVWEQGNKNNTIIKWIN